jgi:hypothetical protein
MPIKSTALPLEHHRQYTNISFEQYAARLFLADGWEVLKPYVDHGRKTDLVVSDGHVFYRIQIKSLDTTEETVVVKNQWKNSDTIIDYVIYFSKRGNWGYIIKPFSTNQMCLNNTGGVRFHQHEKNFAQAFAKI